MNKPVIVHLKNKYPKAVVLATDVSIDVYDGPDHLISVIKDGSGSWLDQSESLGLSGRLDMAPIPKDARVHKLLKDGKMGLDEKASERRSKREKFQCKKTGKIKSIEELSSEGFRFDGAGVVTESPRASEPVQNVQEQP